MSKVLSFDIGGTSIKYGIVDSEGNIIWKSEMDTEAYLDGSHIVKKVKEKVEEIVQREQIIGVAISTAGIVDPVKGRIAEASDTIKGYKGQEIKEVIENAFGIKTTVENDVNCAALGEMWKGAGKRKLNAFCMTIGTGVGGCAIVDKRVLSGNTFSAGEVGYMNIDGGVLDITGSTRGIVNRVAERKGVSDKSINGKIIFDLAKKGDSICIEEIDRMIDNISTVISMVSYIINPEVIILGGGITKQSEYLLNKFIEKSKRKIIPYVFDDLDIKLAELGNDAGMVGAVYNFLNNI